MTNRRHPSAVLSVIISLAIMISDMPEKVCGGISYKNENERTPLISPCPCSEQGHCETITGPPVNPRGELFGFYGSFVNENGLPPGHGLNFTHITTVAWASQDEVMCLAHQHGARAVIAAPPIDLDALVDKDARRKWIESTLHQVQSTYRDGVVFDYEEPQEANSIGGRTYATLISETRHVFHEANPSLQVSTCVPWSPDHIDGRAFPFVDLADGSDLLYVMDYDTRSQVFSSQCIAGPNAPFPGMVHGIERYLDLGIEPKKLILGVPWYGYRYPCLPGTLADATICPTESKPFRGVNCSDAVGSEVGYASIRETLRGADSGTTGGLRRDDNTYDPFFNSQETDNNGNLIVYQYWYDDPLSLRRKYSWASSKGLGGIGPYVFNFLDSTDAPEDALAMWTALDAFFLSLNSVVESSKE